MHTSVVEIFERKSIKNAFEIIETKSIKNAFEIITLPNPQKRILYYLHLHKCGGTSFCKTARLNGEQGNFKDNCNVQPDQRCCGKIDTIEDQIAFAKKTSYSVVANEQYMMNDMVHSHYRYVTSLRSAKARYLSHYRHANPRDSYNVWLRSQPDNWNTRHICGTRCVQRPQLYITRADFDYTLKRLRNFDNVLFLDDWNATFNQLASKIGWKPWKNNMYSNRQRGKLTTIEAEDYRFYVLDDALIQAYKTGNHTIEHNWQTYDSGNKRKCTNPCCGICSKY